MGNINDIYGKYVVYIYIYIYDGCSKPLYRLIHLIKLPDLLPESTAIPSGCLPELNVFQHLLLKAEFSLPESLPETFREPSGTRCLLHFEWLIIAFLNVGCLEFGGERPLSGDSPFFLPGMLPESATFPSGCLPELGVFHTSKTASFPQER